MVSVQVKQFIEETTKKYICELSEEKAKDSALLLKALSDPTRLRIINLLLRHEDEICVTEVTEAFTLMQPTITHHLLLLKNAGLIACRKKETYAYYYVKKDKLREAQEVIASLL